MYSKSAALGVALAVSALAAPAYGADNDVTADQRARALLQRMTIDEKILLVHGAGLGASPLGGGGFIAGIPRLGIPALNMADSGSGVNAGITGATAFPAPLAIAASWDTALAYDVGSTIAQELRTLGFAVSLGTGVNLAREPRNGRTFEYMGEDPVLAGAILTERTRATQAHGVVATAKHFIGNEQETSRFASNSIIAERVLRELYLLPFEMVVKDAAPGNVMCAYNLVNGVKACESKELITDVLKGEWGYKGVVQSDWIFDLTDTVHGATAGLDEEQPGSHNDFESINGLPPTQFNQKLKAAVESGNVLADRLDDIVFRKLRTLYKVGIMDHPPVAGGKLDKTVGNVVAQRAAAQSMVLLKNAAAGSVTYYDGLDAAQAAAAAANADVATVFATQFISENMDLLSLSLPNQTSDPVNQAYDQDALIAAVAASNKSTVVVLQTGTAVLMPWLNQVGAVLEAWYPGNRGGEAIADVLFGDVNPSGKLPLTFPQREQDLPQTAISATDTTVNYTEGLNIGYRWFDSKGIQPLFPFGHGLSYTSFKYSGLNVRKQANGDLLVKVTLKNVGARSGAEVAQIYAGLPASGDQPPQRLLAWQKLTLKPGETRQLRIRVAKQRLYVWNTNLRKMEIVPGQYSIKAGGSSRSPAMLSTGLKF